MRRANRAARGLGPEICQVTAYYTDAIQDVTVVNSIEEVAQDLARLLVVLGDPPPGPGQSLCLAGELHDLDRLGALFLVGQEILLEALLLRLGAAARAGTGNRPGRNAPLVDLDERLDPIVSTQAAGMITST